MMPDITVPCPYFLGPNKIAAERNSARLPDDGQFFKGIRLLVRFNRFFGLSFLQNLQTAETVSFSFASAWPWIVYAITIWSLGGLFIVLVIQHNDTRDLKYKDLIPIIYNIGISSYLFLSLIIRGTSTLFHSQKIAKMVRFCANLETSVGFGKKETLMMKILLFGCLGSQISHIVQVIVDIVVFERNEQLLCQNSSYNAAIPPFLSVLAKIGHVICTPSLVIVELWVVYYAGFLATCFGRVRDRLIDVLNAAEINLPKFDEVHRLYLRTVDCAVESRDVLSVGILVCFSGGFIFCCFTICLTVIQRDVESSQKYLFSFLGCFLRIMVPTFFAGNMASKAKDMQDIIQKAMVLRRSRNEEEELRKFRETVDSAHVHFTAAGFFTVDYPMLVSMVSAIITYAVILIQGLH